MKGKHESDLAIIKEDGTGFKCLLISLDSSDVKETMSKITYVNFTDDGDYILNGKFVGKRIFAPYVLDISSFLLIGKNAIEIRVLPTPLNYYIGQGVSGNKPYQQFKRSEGKLMSNGLVGDVRIMKLL